LFLVNENNRCLSWALTHLSTDHPKVCHAYHLPKATLYLNLKIER